MQQENESKGPHGVKSIDLMLVWIVEINDTRLYWLWIKYFILAGNEEHWQHFEKVLPALSRLTPITDTLSYALYGLRISLYLFLAFKRGQLTPCTSHEEVPQSIFLMRILSDFLWGLSNSLSLTCLTSSSMKPHTNTPGWWGNMNMQILLCYDAIIGILIHMHEKSSATKWPYKRALFLANFIYNSALIAGFCIFRGFIQDIKLKPSMGALLCVSATLLFNSVAWLIHYLQYQEQPYQNNACSKRWHMSLSISMDFLFPITAWSLLNTNYFFPSLIVGLVGRSILNIYLKYETHHSNKPPRQQHSFFREPVHVETDTFSLENAIV